MTYRQVPASVFHLRPQGGRYDAILADAFPHANLSRWSNPEANCQALPEAEDWLKAQQPRWRIPLNNEPGYNRRRSLLFAP